MYGMAGNQEASLKQVFRELQDMGLISSTRKLQPFKHGPKHRPDSHAGLLRRSRIYYWLDDSKIEVDGLRFVLLHEERHQRGHLSAAAYFISFIGWSSFFVYLYLTGHFLHGPQGLLYLLLPVAVWYSTWPFAMIDERRSDLWATRLLKERFGIARPSLVVAKAFEFPPMHLSAEDRFVMRLMKTFHTDYHPTKEKRIELIAKNVDDHEE